MTVRNDVQQDGHTRMCKLLKTEEKRLLAELRKWPSRIDKLERQLASLEGEQPPDAAKIAAKQEEVTGANLDFENDRIGLESIQTEITFQGC